MPSKIEWTQETWNPVTGCTRVSPGCDHCYMFAQYPRLRGMHVPGYQVAPDVVTLLPERLEQPSAWKKPKMIFVCSMSDLFHPRVPWEFICKVFQVMAETPHTYQVLTKRPGRMSFFAEVVWPWWNTNLGMTEGDRRVFVKNYDGSHWPENVWAGTSVESAKYLPRLDVLARVPAKVRFVSCEPLLGPLDLRPWLNKDWVCGNCRMRHHPKDGGIVLAKAVCRCGPGLGQAKTFHRSNSSCGTSHTPYRSAYWMIPDGSGLINGAG